MTRRAKTRSFYPHRRNISGMRLSYLGKNHLHWCDTCGTPVLGKKCSCGTQTREVALTPPPGDIRPAFDDDISHINRVYRDHFGAELIPEGHVAILNKVPDFDRMEEIIMGGAVVGAIRFYPDEERWEAMPRPAAALYMTPSLRYMVVDPGAETSIRTKGASVLAPGLISIEEHVEAGGRGLHHATGRALHRGSAGPRSLPPRQRRWNAAPSHGPGRSNPSAVSRQRRPGRMCSRRMSAFSRGSRTRQSALSSARWREINSRQTSPSPAERTALQHFWWS